MDYYHILFKYEAESVILVLSNTIGTDVFISIAAAEYVGLGFGRLGDLVE